MPGSASDAAITWRLKAAITWRLKAAVGFVAGDDGVQAGSMVVR